MTTVSLQSCWDIFCVSAARRLRNHLRNLKNTRAKLQPPRGRLAPTPARVATRLLRCVVCISGTRSPTIPYDPEKLGALAGRVGASEPRAGGARRAAVPPLPREAPAGRGGARAGGRGRVTRPRLGPGRRGDAGPLTLLAPEAARGQATPLGALSPPSRGGRAGPGYRTDLDDLCLRHFLPARRFPDETRSQVFPPAPLFSF